jgi:hypothetical protein
MLSGQGYYAKIVELIATLTNKPGQNDTVALWNF